MKTKIIFAPVDGSKNGYIDIMKHAYEVAAGAEICAFRNIKAVFFAEYAVLNWYENISLSKSPFKKIFGFLIRYSFIVFLKIKGTKIIWTLHNKEPHDSYFVALSKFMMKFLAKHSDFIVIHSSQSRNVLKNLITDKHFESKTILVPHPCYGNYYGKPVERNKLNNEKLQLLFLGGVAKYKNLEMMTELVKELNLPNLNLEIVDRFITGEAISQYLSNCHILVIPYEMKTMLNSGSIMLAFSYKRTVISPTNGTLADIDGKSLFFDYEYSSPQEHREKLKKIILDIYTGYAGKYDDLLEIGQKCFEYVERNNNFEIVLQILREKIFNGKENG